MTTATRTTFRRDRLLRLAQGGKLVLAQSYHYDEMSGAQKTRADYMASHCSTQGGRTLRLERGKRYGRVVRIEAGQTSGSAHAFIDATNGDVLKPAGWKAPAKHARGNIFDDHGGLKYV